jgi:hypothetical protein
MEMQHIVELLLAKIDGMHKKMMERLEAKMDAIHEKMIASHEQTITKMDAWLAEMKDGTEEMMACQETIEARL